MRTGEGFLLVYSVDSRRSFEETQYFYQQIQRVKDRNHYPVVLVANKCDLVREREISKSEGLALAQYLGVPLVETSAKLRINVDESFCALVREVFFALIKIRKYNRQRSIQSITSLDPQKSKWAKRKKCSIL